MQCGFLHRMSPDTYGQTVLDTPDFKRGEYSTVRCNKQYGHDGDCLVTYRDSKWLVSQLGFEDHPPEEIVNPFA